MRGGPWRGALFRRSAQHTPMLLQFIARKPLYLEPVLSVRAELRRAGNPVVRGPAACAPVHRRWPDDPRRAPARGHAIVASPFPTDAASRATPQTFAEQLAFHRRRLRTSRSSQCGELLGNYVTLNNTIITPCVKMVLTNAELLDRLSRWKLSLTMTT